MGRFLISFLFGALGTFLLLYSVIAYEPPAFIAYILGAGSGFCWAGVVSLWFVRRIEGEK